MKLGSNVSATKIILSIFLVIFFIFLSVPGVLAYEIPNYQGPVSDFANVLSDTEEKKLEKVLLDEARKDLGVEVAVVTLTSLAAEPIEYVSQQIFDTWGIGKSETDSGILIVLVIDDKIVRLQTGYGAEVFLTDAEAGRIIRNDMTPFLRNEKYAAALTIAVEKIFEEAASIDQQELINENATGSIWSDAEADPFSFAQNFFQVATFIIVVLTYGMAFLGRTKSWWLGGFIGGVFGAILFKQIGFVVFGSIGLVLDYILSKNYRTWKVEHKATAWRNTWGGFHSRKSPSKFTFGGGRSGGGGATGKW